MEKETKTKAPANNNLMAAITYLFGPITGIIFLLLEKKDQFIRFHAMQSTITFGGIFILGIILAAIPVLGWMVQLLLWPIQIILWIVLMYKAYSGEKYMLPYVGEMAEQQLKKI